MEWDGGPDLGENWEPIWYPDLYTEWVPILPETVESANDGKKTEEEAASAGTGGLGCDSIDRAEHRTYSSADYDEPNVALDCFSASRDVGRSARPVGAPAIQKRAGLNTPVAQRPSGTPAIRERASLGHAGTAPCRGTDKAKAKAKTKAEPKAKAKVMPQPKAKQPALDLGFGFGTPRRPTRPVAVAQSTGVPTGYSGRWEALNLLSQPEEEEERAEVTFTEEELDALGAWTTADLNASDHFEDSYATHAADCVPGDEILPRAPRELSSLSPEVDEEEVLGEVDVTVDSGAAASMWPSQVLKGYKVYPTAEVLNGTPYRAANGEHTVEKGLAVPLVQLENGTIKRMICCAGPVHKRLTAAAEICAHGNRIVLDDDGSFILNKRSGEVTPIRKKGNTYIMHVKVLRPSAVKAPSPKTLAAVGDAADGPGEASFPRQARP